MRILFVEKVKTQENAWNIHYQWHKISCRLFLVAWNNAARIRDKVMVVFKEMARDGAKFNEKKLKNVHYNERFQSHPKSTREKYKACASTIQLKLFVQTERKRSSCLRKDGCTL